MTCARTTMFCCAFFLCLGVAGLVLPLSAQQDDSIISTYQKALAADPNDVIAQFNLGLAYYNMERIQEAKAALEKCLALNRRDQAAHREVDGPANQLLGILYYSHLKDDRRAINYFRSSLQHLPDDADTHHAMGLTYLRLKEYGNAVQSFKKALENGRAQDPEVFYSMGRAHYEMGQYKETIESYEQSLRLKPDFQPALEALALLYHRQEQNEKAIVMLKRLVRLDPMNFNANYLLGLNYYRQKNYSEMVAAYNRAVAVKPDLADAHYNLGMAYYYQTRYDLAIEALKKAVTLNPKDGEAFNLLGQAQSAAAELHLQNGTLAIAKEQYNEAIAEFQKVLQIDATHHKAKALLEDSERKLKEEYEAHMLLAGKFYRDKRLEDAYNEYELALRLDPGSQEAREGLRVTKVQLGKLLAGKLASGKEAEKMGDYQSARERYEAALQLQSNYAPAREALRALEGKLLAMIKNLHAGAKKMMAQDDLKEAIVKYRRMKDLAVIIGNAEWEEKALASLTRVNDMKAETIKNYLEKGKQAYKSKANINATKLFNKVLALDPQNKTANEYIMRLTGTQSAAKVAAEKVKEMYYKGVDLYVKGRIEEAIKAWQEVIELDPDNQDAQINIERAQAKLVAIRKLTEGK